ncbi:4'-phosphopantetheinyl transferase superfamily protein [Streptomyces sp. NPDC046727]|uniref:4'-phosphopantetheinyl transferase family protein n=1 Tax=Streptomyces sp. NPDC046727 TaxID=3155373 RepID=UPI00340DBEDE
MGLEFVLVKPAPLDAPAHRVLDAEERRRVAAFARSEDAEIYAAAHAALRYRLGALLCVAPQDVMFVRLPCPGCGERHGRPAIAGRPDVHFSLSHTKGLALLAFADHPVGADVERHPTQEQIADLVALLHPSEQRELRASRSPAGFTRCWTRKEAFLKATGEGIGGDGLSRQYAGTGEVPAEVPGARIIDLPNLPEGYEAAVCVLDQAATL